ncbi:hypothetical protein F383_39420 [Gossypium arboreum]|uniref:Uncharacterized protein n=1 Tax=Gossypium arboreum TaxID=29729 RepID=A0A0B0MR95_GOSAR|nr:hypothetical protein F383_39420 [Gossypium arboreum]
MNLPWIFLPQVTEHSRALLS